MIRIETEQLIISSFHESDAYELLDYLSHPRENCFLGKKLNTLEEAIADVKKRKEDELQLSVCMKWDDTIIGNLFALKEEPDTNNDLTNQKSSTLAGHTNQHTTKTCKRVCLPKRTDRKTMQQK